MLPIPDTHAAFLAYPLVERQYEGERRKVGIGKHLPSDHTQLFGAHFRQARVRKCVPVLLDVFNEHVQGVEGEFFCAVMVLFANDFDFGS